MPELTDSVIALNLKGVTKRYPGTLAVDNVDFAVRSGEIHALVGENGAGKSTLVKLIAGSFDDYFGTVTINAVDVLLHSPASAKRHGIELIHQELSLALPRPVSENVLSGRLPAVAGFFIDRRRLESDAKKWLAEVGLDVDPSVPVESLSPHEAQLVEIARALSNNPAILVLDEPTSSLSRDETDRLFELLRRLRSSGLAIVYISHHISEIFTIADRVSVMRDGRRVATEQINEVTPEQLIYLMVGRDASDLQFRRKGEPGDTRFEVKSASRRGFFQNISFSVRSSEILGIGGLSGSGRTELARSLCGIDPLHSGSIVLDGSIIAARNAAGAIRNGFAYLTEDRKADGLALRLAVTDNLLAACAPRQSRAGLFTTRSCSDSVSAQVKLLDVQPPDPSRQAANLSGGNQQKVLLGKWVAAEAQVLFLDEPTRGVDIAAKLAIHAAIGRLAAEGKCIVLISSDLPELVSLSDRVVVMRKGRIAEELPSERCTEEAILLAANGQSSNEARPRLEQHPVKQQHGSETSNPSDLSDAGTDTVRRRLSSLPVVVATISMVLLGCIASRHFLSVDNMMSVLQAVALLGIVACGVSFVTYTGNYADLSVPGTMALSGIVTISALRYGFGPAVAAGIGSSLVVGAANGLVVGYLRVNPIVWTLAAGAAIGGVIRWAFSGAQVYPDGATEAGRAFLALYSQRVFGAVPLVVAVLMVLALLAGAVMVRTLFGFQARLVGASYEAARLSGVRVERIVALSFILSAFASGIGGILLASLNKVGAPYIGQGYDFMAVTGIVLGGMTLAGGRGSVLGVLSGVLVIGVIRNIMNLLGWGTFQQDICQGLVFILVVGSNALLLRRQGLDDA